MKRTMMGSVLAASAVTAIAPASAQMAGRTWQGGGWNGNAFWRGAPAGPWERIRFLQDRIDRGIADGSLDRREGMRAQMELRRVRMKAGEMRRRDRGMFDAADSAAIQDRLDRLSQQIRWARHNGW